MIDPIDEGTDLEEELADIVKEPKPKPKKAKRKGRQKGGHGTTKLRAEEVLDASKVYQAIRKATLNRDPATVMSIIKLRELYAGDQRLLDCMQVILESAQASCVMIDATEKPDTMDEATFKVWSEQQKIWVTTFADHVVGLLRQGISTNAYRNMLDEADKMAGIEIGTPRTRHQILDDDAGKGEEE